MKRQLFILNFLLITLFIYSCGEEGSKIDYDFEYIQYVEVISPKANNVEVDNFAKRITIEFPNNSNLDAVRLRFKLGKDVVIDGADDYNIEVDLNKNYVLKLSHKKEIVSFHIVPKLTKPVFDPVSKGWEEDNSFGTLPSYTSVYKRTKDVSGKNMIAYIGVVNMKDKQSPKFSVLGNATGYSTPSRFYEQNSKPSIVLNAGYFWDGRSLGLIIRDGVTINQAQPMSYRTFNNESVVYYPTQGAFGLNRNGEFETQWVYSSNKVLYAYPEPAPNHPDKRPLPIPTASQPKGATPWEPVDAIGAGPILIKDGVYENRWEAEMFDNASGIAPTHYHPRSAIGYTESGHLIFFVCEGRNKTPNTPGLTLKQVSDLLLELGCIEALNLDGGGSSCMLINGKETIIPSDGKQRTVTTVVAVN